MCRAVYCDKSMLPTSPKGYQQLTRCCRKEQLQNQHLSMLLSGLSSARSSRESRKSRSVRRHMSIDIRHKALKKSSRRWLINACNPWNMGDSAVEDVPAAEVRDLLFAAELHGVLPIVHKRFRQLFAQHSTSSNPAASALADAIRNARQILVGQAAFELMLRHQAERVMAEFRQIGLDAAVIKGPTFARRLYAEPSLRSFSDIDILIPVGSRAVVGGIMSKLGFKAVERDYRGSTDYFEDVWVLETN